MFGVFFPLVQALLARNGACPFRAGCPFAWLPCDDTWTTLPALGVPLSSLPWGRTPPPGPPRCPRPSRVAPAPPPHEAPSLPPAAQAPAQAGPARPYRLPLSGGCGGRSAPSSAARRCHSSGRAAGGGAGRPPRCTLGAVVREAGGPTGERRGADYGRQGAAGCRRRAQARPGRVGVVFDGVTGGRGPWCVPGPARGPRSGRRRERPTWGGGWGAAAFRPGLGAQPPGERGGQGRGGAARSGAKPGVAGAGAGAAAVGRGERVTGALRGGRGSLWGPSGLRGRRSPPCRPWPWALVFANFLLFHHLPLSVRLTQGVLFHKLCYCCFNRSGTVLLSASGVLC